jgi:hypothetical protein
MASKRIAWEALEPALRQLKKAQLLQVLRATYQALPPAQVVSVFGEYVDLTRLDSASPARKGTAPGRLLEAVQRFHAESLAGHYYESFPVNSKNCRDRSEGTELWISQCNRLFDQCGKLSRKGHHAEVHTAMELLFELLKQIDTGSDEIIFFADEAGSWQVGIDAEQVLPVYFTSLAAVATPEEYATRVVEVIKEWGSYAAERFLNAARKAANAVQRKALATKWGTVQG